MYEDAISFWDNYNTWRPGRVQANRGQPILGYSLIHEVSKKPPSEETISEKEIGPRAEAIEDTQKAPLSKLVPEKCIHIGSDLSKNEKDSLMAFLHEN